MAIDDILDVDGQELGALIHDVRETAPKEKVRGERMGAGVSSSSQLGVPVAWKVR
jgi:hypothetical protein